MVYVLYFFIYLNAVICWNIEIYYDEYRNISNFWNCIYLDGSTISVSGDG